MTDVRITLSGDRIYRSTAPVLTTSLPSPLATGLSGVEYVDAGVTVPSGGYYYRAARGSQFTPNWRVLPGGSTSLYRNIHLLGDSFANVYVGDRLFNLSKPYTTSRDGLSGANMANHLARFTATPERWADILIITDDMTGANAAADIATYQQIVALLDDPKRFLIMEPGVLPAETTGSAERIARDAFWNAIVAAFPDNTVPVLAAMQGYSDGSANDLAEIAKGLWPLSCKVSVSDFHPNAKGGPAYADIAVAAARARGWV